MGKLGDDPLDASIFLIQAFVERPRGDSTGGRVLRLCRLLGMRCEAKTTSATLHRYA